MDLEKVLALIGVVATASGYVAIQMGIYTRYRASVLGWEQRLFESALLGGVLFTLARFIVVGVDHLGLDLQHTPAFLVYKEALPFTLSVSLAITVALGILLGRGINVWIRPFRALEKIIDERGNARQIELLDALRARKALLFNFKSGRVVVGFVLRLPPFDRNLQVVTLLPLMYGVRQADGIVRFDRSVEKRFEGIDAESFEALSRDLRMTVDLDSVDSVATFNDDFTEHLRANR